MFSACDREHSIECAEQHSQQKRENKKKKRRRRRRQHWSRSIFQMFGILLRSTHKLLTDVWRLILTVSWVGFTVVHTDRTRYFSLSPPFLSFLLLITAIKRQSSLRFSMKQKCTTKLFTNTSRIATLWLGTYHKRKVVMMRKKTTAHKSHGERIDWKITNGEEPLSEYRTPKSRKREKKESRISAVQIDWIWEENNKEEKLAKPKH